MGIASVGHRLTILKSVYDVKKAQDVPIESDHYLPLCTLSPISPLGWTGLILTCNPCSRRRRSAICYRNYQGHQTSCRTIPSPR
jgi:hypothetical protein